MKPILKIVFSLILTLSFFKPTYAQNCAERIDIANKLLETKEYLKSLKMVQSCIEPNQSKSLRWQAYRVMAISYLYLGNTDSARFAAIALLKLNPGYVPDPINNPKAFIKLLNKRNEVKPYTFYSHLFLGSTHAQVKVLNVYAVQTTTKTYIPLSGGQLGGRMGMYINSKFSVDFGASVLANRYAIQYDIPNWKLFYIENQSTVQAPISVQYLINPESRLRCGFRLGAYKQYLITSENSFGSTYLPTNSLSVLSRELSSKRRNRWSNGYILGLTALYKTGRGHLNFEASFSKSNTQYNKPEKRFDDNHLYYHYFYMDDDIYLNSFTFSIGYTHLIHKAIKKFD